MMAPAIRLMWKDLVSILRDRHTSYACPSTLFKKIHFTKRLFFFLVCLYPVDRYWWKGNLKIFFFTSTQSSENESLKNVNLFDIIYFAIAKFYNTSVDQVSHCTPHRCHSQGKIGYIWLLYAVYITER